MTTPLVLGAVLTAWGLISGLADASSPACSLPTENIQQVVRGGVPGLRACYQRALRANRDLRGRVVVHFLINRDGSVQTARDGGSNLPDADVIACALGVVRALTFPASGRVTVVAYPFMLTPGGGSLPDSEVSRVLEQARPRFQLCYERARRDDPSLEGRLRVRFVIDRNGEVRSAAIQGSTLGDADSTACILEMFYGLAFPASDAGDTTVVQSLTFRG